MESMKTYVGTKTIKARPMTRGEYCELKRRVIPGDPQDEGWLVAYPDGYESWSPNAPFKEAYHAVCEGMTFGGAIHMLKQGKKVARKGWNGKGMYLWLKPAAVIKREWCRDPELITAIDKNGGEEISCLGTICMYTHDSTGRNAVLTGWLASQSDMLCEDWVVVE